MAGKPKCVMVLSTKSAGSSALQHLICRFGGGRHVERSRHTSRSTVETLYWTKAASVLGLPQVRLPDSEVPIPRARAERDLHELLTQNIPGYVPPADPDALVFEGWRALCHRYAPVFVEKSPHHLHQWSALKLIAQAARDLDDVDFRFVGIVRNPMDALYSAWRRWRMRPDIFQHHWRMAYDNLHRWRDVAGEYLMTVRYEDFSTGPQTAARLMEFLGLQPLRPDFDRFIHGISRQRWKYDPWFRFQLDPRVEAAAKLWGYTRDDLYNVPHPMWKPYSCLTRLGYRLWRLPEQRLRRTARRVLGRV